MSDFNLVLPGDEAAQKAAEEAEAQLKAAQTAMPETAPTLDFSQKPAPAMPTLTLPSEEAQIAPAPAAETQIPQVKFSPEEQQLLLQCAAEAASWQRAHWQGAEVKAMLRASRSGCYMALLSEEQTELFRDAAQPLYEHLSETQKEVVRRVRALSDEPD